MHRSMTGLACLAVAGVLSGASLSAQGTVSAQADTLRVQKGVAEAGFKMAVSAGGEMERVVKNAPFSAQAVTTTTQVLADGNRIQQTSEMSLARDSEGRTRREMSVDKIGPWSTDTNGRIVFIRDPVALAIYELAPDGQHATKRTLYLPVPDGPQKREAQARVQAKLEAERARTTTIVHDTAHAVTMGDQPFEFSTMIIGGPESAGEIKKETLGEQVLEGVRVQGTRETRTIAAGKIGNERPIDIVSETWYAPDLQMVVQSRHSDPRVGETIYKLTNIAVTEPDPTLFQVPATYTVQDQPDRVMRIDLVKKALDDQERPEPPPPPQER